MSNQQRNLDDVTLARIEMVISQGCRKALCVQVGESAGNEIADLLLEIAARVQRLERSKVNVTPIAPADSENLLHLVGDDKFN